MLTNDRRSRKKRVFPFDNVSWTENLEKVVAFVKVCGRMPVKRPSVHSDLRSEHSGTGSMAEAEEQRLANWRHTYVTRLNRGVLDAERAKLLRASGLLVDHGEAKWDKMLARTKRFVETYGRLPTRKKSSATSAEEQSLGRWRSDQDALIRKGELSASRKEKLAAAKLTGGVGDVKWFQNLKAVVQFKKAHGFLPRKTGELPDEQRLGLWCVQMRQRFDGLSDQRRRVFQAAGLAVKPKSPDRWMGSYGRLKAFCENAGRLPRVKGEGDERKNRHWLQKQLDVHANGTLIPDRRKLITTLTTRYSELKSVWQERWELEYRALDLFIQRHGRLPTQTRKDSVEFSIGLWLDRQKKRARLGRLPREEARQLELLHPGLKDFGKVSRPGRENFEERWTKNYERVLEIAKRTGFAPDQLSADRSERTLYSWYQRERRIARDEEKKRLIDEIEAMVTHRKYGPKKRG